MESSSRLLGVSVAICTHNGEKRLGPVLDHLKVQRAAQIPWEVIVIDNASSDRTAEVARACWADNAPVPLRVVHESRLGLSYARLRAFIEARYEFVSFIDDDNWVEPDWIYAASWALSNDPSLGAILSVNRPIADGPLPPWFPRYSGHYAAWATHECAPPPPSHVLIGAGMTVRKAVFAEMVRKGFRPFASDRAGRRLSSAGDVELGYALILAGWGIRLEPKLRLQHYITDSRLQWNYCRRLLRAQEESNVVLDAYFWVAQTAPGLKNRLREKWWWHFAAETVFLLRHHSVAKLIGAWISDLEGDDEAIEIEKSIGKLIGLARMRSRYTAARRKVAQAAWRQIEPFPGLTNS